MADEKNSSPLASQFSGLPMKALIGAPLKAATDANAMISRAQTEFLLATCFKRTPNADGKLRPIMVKFQMERNVLNNDGSLSKTPLLMDISVPLMSLIPINSLAIETLKINFAMEVKSSKEYSRNSSSTTENDKKDNKQHSSGHNFETELHGTLAQQDKISGKTGAGANYEVTLTAGQLPLPVGVTAILDIFTKNLAPLPAKSNTDDN